MEFQLRDFVPVADAGDQSTVSATGRIARPHQDGGLEEWISFQVAIDVPIGTTGTMLRHTALKRVREILSDPLTHFGHLPKED